MKNLIEENGKFYLVRESKKVFNSATYKQLKYLESFDNVENTISTSQFIKYVDKDEASEAIELAKEGKNIVIE